MHKQSGNFLLQALLALTLVFVFMPFFAKKIAMYDSAAQMYSATNQIETVYGVARVYLRENKDDLPYKKTVLSKDKLIDVLEQYGLPFGFIPKTSLNQDIYLIVDKSPDGLKGYLKLSGGNLSKMKLAELTRRIGFYAKIVDNSIEVMIPLDEMYSDIVSKKESGENVGFLSELDLNDNSIDKVGILFARNGEFETAQFNSLVLYGVESGKNEKNKISDLYTNKTVFQSADGGTRTHTSD